MVILRARWLAGPLVLAIAAGPLRAQAEDPSQRLLQVLPHDVASRILATITAARADELPGQALEQRALKFAAKGVDPALIERSVVEHLERMRVASGVLEAARGQRAAPDEIEAGAEVLRRGVSGAEIADLARTTPADRSLAVPLFTIGSLIDRGLPSDEALRRVHERLKARAADADLEKMVTGTAAQGGPPGLMNRPGMTGLDRAASRRPGSVGPGAVPRNPGKDARPGGPKPPPRRRGGGG